MMLAENDTMEQMKKMSNIKGSCDSLDKLLQYENLRHAFKKTELFFKVLVIGDYGVGKTSIIRRYSSGTFSSTYKVTIGADFAVKTLEWDDDLKITLHLWDIAGYERFGHLTGVYYRHAKAAAIVFDLTRPKTFNSVEKWLADLRKKVSLPNGQSIPVVLLANKGDVTIESLPKDVEDFCRKHNIPAWYITSAKDDVNIDDAMSCLVYFILNNLNDLKFDTQPLYEDTVDLKKEEAKKENNNCCYR